MQNRPPGQETRNASSPVNPLMSYQTLGGARTYGPHRRPESHDTRGSGRNRHNAGHVPGPRGSGNWRRGARGGRGGAGDRWRSGDAPADEAHSAQGSGEN